MMASFSQALQDKMEIAASRECFIALRTKSFTIMPDCLAEVIKRELTATAREIFRELYGLSEKTWNSKAKTSPVIISASVLVRHNFKSERTVRRRLAELEAKGFIKIKHQFDQQMSVQISNAIWPVLPVPIRRELLQSKDRKNLKNRQTLKLVNDVVKEPCYVEKSNDVLDIKGLPPNIKEPQKYTEQPSEVIAEPAISEQIAITTDKQVYDHYAKEVVALQADGVRIAKANMMAYQRLNQEQKLMFTRYMEREAKKEKFLATQQAQAISVAQGDKIVMHKVYDHDLVNSNPSVDNYVPKIGDKALPKVIVNLNEKITPKFIANEIYKMHSKNEIPQIIFERWRTIGDIVLEVQCHVEHRDVNKTLTPLHALNAAKGLLKKGDWKTPIKYIYARKVESIARESLAATEKARELAEIRQFINHPSQ